MQSTPQTKEKTHLWFEVESECSILMVVEFAVGRLSPWPHAVKAELPRSGLPGVDEARDVFAQCALPEALAGAEDLGRGAVGSAVVGGDCEGAALYQSTAPGHIQ